jgi:uncharacterized protein with HEPN domain
MRDDPLRLKDMLKSIGKIESYTANKSRQDIKNDPLLSDALLYQFSVLGEAAYTISRKLKSMHPEVEWRTLSAMRHWIIHEYFEVNLNTVWETSQTDVLRYKQSIERILREDYPQEPLD